MSKGAVVFAIADANTVARFWAKVQATINGCWVWTAGVDKSGYGLFWVNGKDVSTHRWIWTQHNARPIPDGLLIRHTCDNPPCVNPAHLLLGTNALNSQDKLERNRQARGMRIHGPRRKLDDAAVRRIRALLENDHGVKPLARQFGVTPRVVRLIRDRRIWKYIVDLGPVPED